MRNRPGNYKMIIMVILVWLGLWSGVFLDAAFAGPTKEAVQGKIQELQRSPTTRENVVERAAILRKLLRKLDEKEGAQVVEKITSEELRRKFASAMKCNDFTTASRIVDEIIANLALFLGKKETPSPARDRIISSKKNVKLPVESRTVTIFPGIPGEGDAAEPGSKKEATGVKQQVIDGRADLELSQDPQWIIEGDLPGTKALRAENSPFGFHPASIQGKDYQFARDIGVRWDRGGFYLFWVFPILTILLTGISRQLSPPLPGGVNYWILDAAPGAPQDFFRIVDLKLWELTLQRI